MSSPRLDLEKDWILIIWLLNQNSYLEYFEFRLFELWVVVVVRGGPLDFNVSLVLA